MNHDLTQILKSAVEQKASDIFIIAGLPLAYKVQGVTIPQSEERLMPEDTEVLVGAIFNIAGGSHTYETFKNSGDSDFSFSVKDVGRFRVNAYSQRSSYAAVLRIVYFNLPDPDELGIPKAVMDLSKRTKGLMLVTGPAGSGKSTTLACIIDRINATRNCHIMTLEDPIEFLHRHKKSIVSQREIPTDSSSYLQALRASLRQSPDVILVGEMRDMETINIALTAAETGHLVLSTLHTMGAANTVDRIIDVFPAGQQQQVRIQLALVLQAVVSQQLLQSDSKGRACAFEIMLNTTAISNLIRESKLHQINGVMHSSAELGMQTMDNSLIALVKSGVITRDVALTHSGNPDALAKLLV